MAEIIDKLKSGFNKSITTVGVRTTSTVEKTKIKSQISSLTNEIKKLYSDIGEKTYTTWIVENFNVEIVIRELEQIKQKNTEINELYKVIEKIDEEAKSTIEASGVIPEKAEETQMQIYVCSACKAGFETPVKFCKKCGCKMPETEVKTQEETADNTGKYICSQCETIYDTPKKFCKKCGMKMIEENN